jgi:hypothetical protein
MPVTEFRLLVIVNPLWHDQIELVLGPRHGHVQLANRRIVKWR